MLAVQFDKELECTSSVNCNLAFITTITIIQGNAANVGSKNTLPLEQISSVNWTLPIKTILIHSHNLDAVS